VLIEIFPEAGIRLLEAIRVFANLFWGTITALRSRVTTESLNRNPWLEGNAVWLDHNQLTATVAPLPINAVQFHHSRAIMLESLSPDD